MKNLIIVFLLMFFGASYAGNFKNIRFGMLNKDSLAYDINTVENLTFVAWLEQGAGPDIVEGEIITQSSTGCATEYISGSDRGCSLIQMENFTTWDIGNELHVIMRDENFPDGTVYEKEAYWSVDNNSTSILWLGFEDILGYGTMPYVLDQSVAFNNDQQTTYIGFLDQDGLEYSSFENITFTSWLEQGKGPSLYSNDVFDQNYSGHSISDIGAGRATCTLQLSNFGIKSYNNELHCLIVDNNSMTQKEVVWIIDDLSGDSVYLGFADMGVGETMPYKLDEPVSGFYLNYPNGSENYDRGSVCNVSWMNTETGKVKLDLYTNDGFHFHSSILDSTEAESYDWSIPLDLYGNDFKIKLSSVMYPDSIYDFSDASFTVNTGQISVTAPNTGETISRGDQFEITWSKDISEYVKIELFDNEAYYSTIIDSTDSDGSYMWDVPHDIYGSNYKIKISSLNLPDQCNDLSDTPFTVDIGEITVTAPNTSVDLNRGSQYEITWTDDINEKVKIDLYKNDIYHSTVTDSTDSDGTFMWITPTDLYGTDFKIKISSVELPYLCSDISDAVFQILSGNISVLNPNGGEELINGTQNEITWSDDISESVIIDLYQNETYHSSISNSTNSDGSFLWDIPSELNGTGYKLKISSLIIPDECNDMSDSAFTIPSSIVTITAPNTVTELTRGTQYEITWTDEFSDDVKIELYQSESFYSVISDSTESDGTYIWNIPEDIFGTDFKIKVSSLIAPDIRNDMSDDPFSISTGNITVLTPNDSLAVDRGTQYEIAWTDDIDEKVMIELYKSEIYHSTISDSTESDGSFIWDIPPDLFGTDFKVKISSVLLTDNCMDESDNFFTVRSGEIVISYPNGTEVLTAGSQINMIWADDIAEDVRIELLQNDVLHSTISDSTESDGSYTWDIPLGIYGNDFKIKVSSVMLNDDCKDESNNTFSIKSGEIALTYPNGGEVLSGGSQVNINWTDDIAENIKIDLYIDDVYDSEISASTESDGSYTWTVPDSLNGEKYKIKLSSVLLPEECYDISESDFIVIDGKIQMVSPDGNEVLYHLIQHEIVWYDNLSEKVKIELFKDGNLDHVITSSTESDGSYLWNIPDSLSGSDFQIRISSVILGQIHNDSSDNYFTIIPGKLVLLTPNGGETIMRDRQYEITWMDSLDENIKIELYNDSIFHSDVILSTESDGSFIWSVPDSLYGTGFEIKLSSTVSPELHSDMSLEHFSIDPGEITITSPNGGEMIERSSQFEITWIDSISEPVSIDLYKDSLFLQEITSSTPSTGSFIWDVPDSLYGDDFLVRISSVILPDQCYDFSDSVLTVSPGYIWVNDPNGAEVLERGSQYEITWSDSILEDVKIELIQDSLFHSEIVSSTPSDGSYNWDIPDSLFGDTFRIKISSIILPEQCYDISDSIFTISPGYLSVTSPNGNETLERGNQFEISWIDSISENVGIELLQNDSLYSDIITSTESDGSFLWTVPDTLYGSNYQVRISSVVIGEACSDMSDGYFSISNGTISVISPQETDTLEMLQNFEIQWTDDIPEDVIIEIYKDSLLITDMISPSDGACVWNCYTDSITSGNDYKVKIISSYDDNVFSESDFFTIKGTNNISGSLSGVWSEPYSPYILRDSSFIEVSNSLIIEELVKVKGYGEFIDLDVFGELYSIGTYVRNVNLDDIDILFDNSSSQDSSKIVYTNFSVDSITSKNTGFESISIINNSKVIIQNSKFENYNDFSMVLNNSMPVVCNNLFISNRNGIKFIDSSPSYFNNNTIADNDSLGIALFGASNPMLINNIIYGNKIFQIYIDSDNSDPELYYNNIQSGITGFGLGTGAVYTGSYISNIDSDPLFDNDSYELQNLSECIDAGYPDLTGNDLGYLYIPMTEMAGKSRLYNDIDIGCYEFHTAMNPESPTNVYTTVESDSITSDITLSIDWDDMPYANSYSVYGSDNPYGIYQLIDSVGNNHWQTLINSETKKFYHITSDSELLKNSSPSERKIKIDKIEEMIKQ